MSEGTQTAPAQEAPSQQQATTPKLWEDAQVREIIVTRDEAKKARREAEAALEATKAEAETLKKAAQQYKAEIESERKKAEQVSAEQAKLREYLVTKITDETLKEIATKEPVSLESLMKMAERQITGPSGDRKPPAASGMDDFDAQMKPKVGETADQYANRVRSLKRPK